MNATFIYISPKLFFNGSKNTGAYADLITKKADFAFNIRYTPSDFNDAVDKSNSFDLVKMCVIVPRNGIESTYYNFFHSLTPMMWILVIGSIIVVTITLGACQYFQSKIVNVPQNHKMYSAIEFTSIVLQSFFGDTIRVTFNLSIQCILLGWLIYSFLITSAFTATIISSLIKPNYLDNINTIAELIESNLTILYAKAIENDLKNGFDAKTWKLIEDNLKEIESWGELLEIMNKSKTKFGYVLADYYCVHVMNSNIDAKTGKSIFHMVPECLTSHPKVYVFQRGSMYSGYINELLGQFHAFGMFQRWIGESKFYALLKGFAVDDEADENIDYSEAKVVITLEYLQTPFYMLGVGLFTSAVIFCMEKLWHQLQDNRLKRERWTC